MPVVELSLQRMSKFLRNKVPEDQILDSLPYVGLDIESQDGDTVRVEYNPNRPDFSSEAGIARSLSGLLGVEIGLPKYDFKQGEFSIYLEEKNLLSTRPFIQCFSARISVTDEFLKRLIAMQEDLHNGIGRRRSVVAIGLHDASKIKPPIRYFATKDRSLTFAPLGSRTKLSIESIITETEQGKAYGHILSLGIFPLLVDSAGEVLSMPPIINGEHTRIAPGADHLLVDVTSTVEDAGETTAAIIAAMLSDSGAQVETAEIKARDRSFLSPDMSPQNMPFDLDLANSVLGLDLSFYEAKLALQKSRLDLWSAAQASIPRYRSDIIHPIDLSEEMAIGYGIMNLTPQRLPKSSLVGSKNPRLEKLDRIIEALIGLEFAEIMNLSLCGEREATLAKDGASILRVEETKSKNYEFLRSELMPGLLGALASNTHEEYPQRVFECGRVMKHSPGEETQVLEETHIATAVAGSGANYTTIKSSFDAFNRLVRGEMGNEIISFAPIHSGDGVFARGRSALIRYARTRSKEPVVLGTIGEIDPSVLEGLGLKVPVASFEISVEQWL
jgi:phenylalanyl-tRNA synthetase beta chain